MMVNEATVVQVEIPEEDREDSITLDEFRSAFRLHPAGVAVVTTEGDDGPAAMTISSLTSVSAEPPIVSISLTTSSYATPAFVAADSVVVHMLSAQQLWLAKLGATGRVDRFADADSWRRLPSGEPLYKDNYAWLRGKVIHRVEAGTSIILLLHVVEASIPEVGEAGDHLAPEPLVYHSRAWHRLGEHSVIEG